MSRCYFPKGTSFRAPSGLQPGYTYVLVKYRITLGSGESLGLGGRAAKRWRSLHSRQLRTAHVHTYTHTRALEARTRLARLRLIVRVTSSACLIPHNKSIFGFDDMIVVLTFFSEVEFLRLIIEVKM